MSMSDKSYTMNVNPKLYDKQNQLQQRDADTLLNKIKHDFGTRKFGRIVDIGCGTGNITVNIKTELLCDEIVAFDMSPEMILFARHVHKCDGVRYEVASASFPWQDLSQSLSIGKSSVDLVLSVHCFHWIPDSEKQQTIDNIYSMLRPGASGYIVFFSWSDLLPLQERMTLDPKWKKYFTDLDLPVEVEHKPPHELDPRQLPKVRRKSSAPFETFFVPSIEERLNSWYVLCKFAGLEVVEQTITDNCHDFGHVDAFHDELRALCHFLPKIPDAERQEFLVDYYAHINRYFVNRNQRQGITKSDVILDYQVITLVVKKPIK